MNWKCAIALGLFLTASLSLDASAQNLVTNGSFEAPGAGNLVPNPGAGIGASFITGWEVFTGDIDYIPPTTWTASDGNMSLDLVGFVSGGIRQTIATVSGETYNVTFDMAANPGGSTLKTLRVSAAGSNALFTFDRTGRTTSNMGWAQKTWSFVATSTSTVLSFENAGSAAGFAGPALDNVRVSAANLLLNGSFESPGGGGALVASNTNPTFITGWEVFTGDIDYIPPTTWTASDGNMSLDLVGFVSGGIRQTIATVPGETYNVTFDMAANPGPGSTLKTLRVSAAGSNALFTFDRTGRTTSNMGWAQKTWSFVATSTSTVLSFENAGSAAGFAGPALDNVRVELQPNQPPVADAGPDQTVECASPDGAQVALDGTGSSDPDGDPLTYTWTGPFGTVGGPTPTVTLALGTHVITLTVSDGQETATDQVVITVEDTTSPDVTAALDAIQKPHGDDEDDEDNEEEHDSKLFAVRCSATDECDPNPSLTSVIETPTLVNPTLKFKVKNHTRLKIDLKKNSVKIEAPDPHSFWAALQSAGGVAVTRGQEIKIEQKGNHKYEYKFDKSGQLKAVEGPVVTLRCTATDAAGNVATATARPPQRRHDDDEDEDDEDERLSRPVVSAPTVFSLGSNYPNPFNPNTTIRYEVPQRAHVTLTVYNLLGQEVVRLVDGERSPGRYSVTWNGTNAQGAGVASGVYLYRITSSSGFSRTKRMTLLK